MESFFKNVQYFRADNSLCPNELQKYLQLFPVTLQKLIDLQNIIKEILLFELINYIYTFKNRWVYIVENISQFLKIN